MAVAVALGRLGPCAALRDRLDVDLQSRSPAHGPGWIYAKAAACHGRLVSTSEPRGKRGGLPSILAPNRLNRQFTVEAADRAWVTDITYLRTWQGWLYLAVVLDLYSRKVVGWAMKPTLARELVLDALLMAIVRRQRSFQSCLRTWWHRASNSGYRFRNVSIIFR